MRTWVEVWDAMQTTCYGIVNLATATVNRRLDGAGSMDIASAIGDPAGTILHAGRWVHLYTNYPNGQKRLVDRGVLQKYKLSIGASPKGSWQCSDASVAFKQVSTYRGLTYISQTVESVIRDLIARVDGWTVLFDNAVTDLYTTQRFDGVSVLKAISKVADTHGLHWMIVPGHNQIRFGALGGDVQLRISNAPVGDVGLSTNSNLALMDSLTQTVNQADMITRIEPISGPADGALTLQFATKTTPYEIRTMSKNGRTVYYLEDDAAVAEYGVIEEVLAPKSLLVPVSNTSFEDVANTLYDWGATQLRRRSQPQRVYDGKITKIPKSIMPGDQVRVDYDGTIYQIDGAATYANVHEVLWVLKVTETYTDTGMTAALQVSNVDEEPADAVNVLANTVINANNARTAVAVNINSSEFSDDLTLGGGVTDTLTVTIPSRAVGVTSCLITLTRSSTTQPGEITLTWDGVEITGAYLQGSTLSETVEIANTVLDGTIAGNHTLTVYASMYTGTVTVKANVYYVIAGATS